MDRIRQLMREKPWMGWIVALVAIAAAGFMMFNNTQSDGRFTPSNMQEIITIKYIDTEEEVRLPRGRVDKMLRGQGGNLDPSKGLINPKTGKASGYPVDKDDWEKWIKRINEDRELMKQPGSANTTPVKPK